MSKHFSDRSSPPYDANVLNLTPSDRSAIAKWRRRMFGALVLMVGCALSSAELYQQSLGPLLSVAVASAESQSPALLDRKLSGSELFRAERCAGLYDCDEDGSWAAGEAAVHAATIAETALRLPQLCSQLEATAELPAPNDHKITRSCRNGGIPK